MHTPVLLEQAINALHIKQGGRYIDATAGEAGHTSQILALGGEVLALDWDEEQVKNLKLKIKNSHVTFVCSSFAAIEEVAKQHDFDQVDGVLFDFGLSMKQLSQSGRGFSFKQLNDPLDMRISTNTQQTAQQLIISLSEDALYEIFAGYSEELDSRAIAQSIVSARRIKDIATVKDLKEVIDKALAQCTLRHTHMLEKSYIRIFQALRIAVNDEFTQIEKGLTGAVNILKPGGRIVAITFHSLEDRVVKQFARRRQDLKLIEEKVPKKYERAKFEKSASLRVIEKRVVSS
jgi:16S rRNA (cytosine1402-N4)-methyltransferase